MYDVILWFMFTYVLYIYIYGKFFLLLHTSGECSRLTTVAGCLAV